MKCLTTILLLCIFCFSSFSQAFLSEEVNAQFVSKAPLNEFDGNSDKLAGLIDLKNNMLDFYLDLNTLKTGISLRDKHMRDNYLETKKYPYAEFTGKILDFEDISFEELKRGIDVKTKGVFKIHGVEQEIEVSGNLKMSNDEQKISLKASFDVALSDYNIEKPSVVGYDLADIQEVNISGDFERQKK